MFSTGPGTVGQASSLSSTPSPSVSGQGQPLFSTGPATVGQASSISGIPSPSVSGQPWNWAKPNTSGQASSLSLIPSLSLSLLPNLNKIEAPACQKLTIFDLSVGVPT